MIYSLHGQCDNIDLFSTVATVTPIVLYEFEIFAIMSRIHMLLNIYEQKLNDHLKQHLCQVLKSNLKKKNKKTQTLQLVILILGCLQFSSPVTLQTLEVQDLGHLSGQIIN